MAPNDADFGPQPVSYNLPLSHTCAWSADVNSMMSLISGWLGNALASGGAVEKPVEDEENMGGLSEVLADILANLQATFAGQPLDVEISYEPGSKVNASALLYVLRSFPKQQPS